MDPAESLPFAHDSGADGTGSYVWEVPGKPVSVEIEPDVVDRMLREVQRGSVWCRAGALNSAAS